MIIVKVDCVTIFVVCDNVLMPIIKQSSLIIMTNLLQKSDLFNSYTIHGHEWFSLIYTRPEGVYIRQTTSAHGITIM